MTGVGDDARGRLLGRPWLIVGLVLAVGATLALVLSDDLRFLRLGIVAALWAALIGAFLAVRYRKNAAHSEDAVAEAQAVYELELEREIAARREYELEIEAETREAAQAQSREELNALRAEVIALRESLQSLLGGEVLLERVALTAQATRMRALNDEQRLVTAGADGKNGNGRKPAQLLAPKKPPAEPVEGPTELMDRVLEGSPGERRRPSAANGTRAVAPRAQQLSRTQPSPAEPANGHRPRDPGHDDGDPFAHAAAGQDESESGPESAAARAVKEAELRADAARRQAAESQPTRTVAPVAKPEPAAEAAAESARQAPRLGARQGPRRRPDRFDPARSEPARPEPAEQTEISAPAAAARRPEPSSRRWTDGDQEPIEPNGHRTGAWAGGEPAVPNGRRSAGRWNEHEQAPPARPESAAPAERRSPVQRAETEPEPPAQAEPSEPEGRRSAGKRWAEAEPEPARVQPNGRRRWSEPAGESAGGRRATGQWSAPADAKPETKPEGKPEETTAAWQPGWETGSAEPKPAAAPTFHSPSRLEQFSRSDLSPLAEETPTGRHGAPAADEPANSTLPESVRDNAVNGTGGRRRRADGESAPAVGRRRRPDGEPPAWENQTAPAHGRRSAPEPEESAHRQHSAPENEEPAHGRRSTETGSHASGRSVTELLAANGKATESTPRRRRRAED
ncbi:hypothetical protein GCM10022222_45480 [Amycolatopsis ultiminotia]|uniref:DUF6779 domain-containing protein n=1 Tax=Amycolatopsis ultiminotia TaxID=543629 RepID=A0ABP6WWB6_9PSEU